MRPEAEIRAEHDRLLAAAPATPGIRAQLDCMCWVLGHAYCL